MFKHRHRFNDIGIKVKYCTNPMRGRMCKFAKDKSTGKVGKFVVIDNQGRIPE